MKKKNKSWFVILVILVILIIGSIFAYTTMTRPVDSNSKEEIQVDISEGFGTGDIAAELKDKGLIRNELAFKLVSKLKSYDGKFKAGTYSLKKSMDMTSIAEALISGRENGQTLTIPEGYNIYKIGKVVEDSGIATREEFDAEVENGKFDYDFLPADKVGKERLEGYLYPDTYSYTKSTSAHDIIDMALKNYEKKYKETIKAHVKKSGKSLHEVMTIASIVEKEAVKAKERPVVASVIYNRLDKGMKLQMDSTNQYILKEDKPVLNYEDIEIPSPYNTYIHEGLPPGPICSPSIDAIEAAVNPAKTDYLYFVVSSKLDGSMEYSKDYDKFEKDKAAYYDALEKKGQ